MRRMEIRAISDEEGSGGGGHWDGISPEDTVVRSVINYAWYPPEYEEVGDERIAIDLDEDAEERVKWKAGMNLIYDVLVNQPRVDRDRLLRSIERDMQATLEKSDKIDPDSSEDSPELEISEMPRAGSPDYWPPKAA
jgi:hypothetical protein